MLSLFGVRVSVRKRKKESMITSQLQVHLIFSLLYLDFKAKDEIVCLHGQTVCSFSKVSDLCLV